MTTFQDCTIGLSAAEGTYGTAVAVDLHHPFIDGVSTEWDPTFAEGDGLQVSKVGPLAALAPVLPLRQLVTVSLPQELYSKGQGRIFKCALGAAVTTQRAATGVYQQNHTPTMTDYLESRTMQVGVPPLGGGAVLPHTFAGAQCNQLEIEIPNSEIVKIKSDWIARDVDTATAYVSAVYPTPIEVLTFAGVTSFTLGGTVTAATTTALATGGTALTNVRNFSLQWDNALDDGGFNLGGGGKRGRKSAVGRRTLTGKFTAEFDAVTLRDYYLNQTSLPLTVTVQGATTIGTGADKPALQIHIPVVRLRGKLPEPGVEVITTDVDFKAFNNGTDALWTLSYVATDTAP